jgi:hypothetical protein
MVVNNMDIAGLVRRMRRFKEEVHKCQSSSLMHTTNKDLDRFRSYLNALVFYFDWMVAQPQQDLPEWHPKDIDLGEPEQLSLPENEALVDLIQQLDALEAEMAYSQSARMHTSVMQHDETRFREIVAKIDAYIDNYVATIQPLDMPESTPRREMTGAGRRSV